MRMDALEVLIEDHRAVNRAFLQYEDLPAGAKADRREAIQEIERRLTAHHVTEQCLHSVIVSVLPRAEEVMADELAYHHEVEVLVRKLDDAEEDLDETVRRLIDLVRARMEVEERTLFPLLRGLVEPTALDQLGETIAAAREPREPPAKTGERRQDCQDA
jgi:hemerythrin-like domain-containing protein